MITREKFREVLKYLIEMHEKIDNFDDKYSSIFTVDFLCEEMPLGDTTSYLVLLEKLLEIDNEWLQYFYYDCSCNFERMVYWDKENVEHHIHDSDEFFSMLYD